MKNSFILYTDYMEHLQLLTNEQKGILLTALFCFQMEIELPKMDSMTQLAFSFISKDMRINNEKYAETLVKRSEAGKLGGAPKGNQNARKQPKQTNGCLKQAKQAKQADNDNVNDNDNENVNVNDNDNVNVKEIKHIYGNYHHVRLKESEIEKLNEELGEQTTNDCIEYLDEYIEMKGYKAKSHYLCIKKWVVDAVKRDRRTDRQKTDDYLKSWEEA